MAESEAESVPSFTAQKQNFRSTNAAKAEKEKEKQKPSLSVIKHGKSSRKKPLIEFSVQHIFFGLPSEERMNAAKWHLAYKFVKTECKIVRNILHQHCFQEVHPNSSDFNLMWTGSHLKPHTLRGLQEFQKINHFPRSYELTRKDRLYQNIQKMQHSKGFKNFDFIPEAYVLPAEYDQFYASYTKKRGWWIVKPVASSRGRGIFLINQANQIPLDDTLLVSKYIVNPLLVDGFKFDLRLYIGVSSFDPLRIYLYEEGLTRFATVKYDHSSKNMRNSCMHLTNYSVNKKSDDYVSCNDAEIEDYGNKWSFGALLRFLKRKGIDTMSLMAKIEDLVIKTVIAGELPIATACKMFVPFPGNCFEIYGFDVLIDDNLKPWLLEVNLSPSMACDSPMDLKIKSNLLIDMFNLTGFVAQDPLMRKATSRLNFSPYVRNQYQRQRCQSAGLLASRELSDSSSNISGKNRQTFMDSERGLTSEELRVLRETREEYMRRGNFVRIFPSPNSRELYSSFLEFRTTNNRMLSARLFMEKVSRNISDSRSGDTSSNEPTYLYGQTLPERMTCYERRLPSLVTEQHRRSPQLKNTIHRTNSQVSEQNTLTQGQLEVRTYQVVASDQSSTGSTVESTSRGVKSAPFSSSNQTSQIDDVIQKAASLSKLQARQAFGMYLQRVKQRLVKEVSCDYDDSGDEDEKAKQDEQMSLVIRFLKRAAKNLQQEFKVLIPSYKLPMQDRRRMLAQQLGEFVRIYEKETAQMKETGVGDSLSKDDEFKGFLTVAGETELEELLTRYTRANNNVSIFLGNSTSEPASSKDPKPPLQRQTHARKHIKSHSAHALSSPSAQDWRIKQRSNQPVTRLSERNRRLAGVVAAYGKSLGLNVTKKRPASAKVSTGQRPSSATCVTRPLSAKTTRDESFGGRLEISHNAVNENSVSEALQKLARRQAVRQYAARPALKIETNKWVQAAGKTDKTKEETTERDKTVSNVRIEMVKPASLPDTRHSNADETFSNFIHYELHSTLKHDPASFLHQNKESEDKKFSLSLSESQINPEELLSSEIKRPCGKISEEVTAREAFDKLGSAREDYNKHIQLLIERLAAHKFDKTSEEKVVPKPPSRPRTAKRPVSAQRLSRITTSHGSVI